MHRVLMKSKIHMACVSECNPSKFTSIEVDGSLLEKVGLYDNEEVQVLNVNTGSRIDCCVKTSKRKNIIALNGAMIHHGNVGDRIVIISYGLYPENEIHLYSPRKIVLDGKNKVIKK